MARYYISRPRISAEKLRSILDYDPETGEFCWRECFQSRLVGQRAGTLGNNGYWCIKADGVRYSAHRLAWLFMTGEWPSSQVDHINGNKTDNRWFNLREAEPYQNLGNRKRDARNTSGFAGVSLCRQTGRWRAQIVVNGRLFHLGRHDTPDEAYAAYMDAARSHRGEFVRHE